MWESLQSQSGETALLVVEKQPVCIVPMQDAVTIRMGIFWIFHMKYPDDHSLLFSLLEILLFDQIPKIHRKVSTLLSSLTHIQQNQVSNFATVHI